MKKLKVLMLGNINSKWVKEYIEYVLLPNGAEVDILGKAGSRYDGFYKENGVTVHNIEPAGKIVSKLPFIRTISSADNTYRGNAWRNYDVIINMFVNHRDLRLTKRVRGRNTKTVVYYVGSDLLRKSKTDIFFNRLLLPNVSEAIVGSEMLAREYRKKYRKNPQVIRVGISGLADIERYMQQHERAAGGKINICVGYNGVREHQHLAVLKLFDALSKSEKEKICLIIPMTYGGSTDYIKEVREKLEGLGIEYRLLTDFMNNEQMAELWCGVDYFINAQITDSLSASVLESIYAGSRLINSAHLDYPEYKEFGIKPIQFGSFDELQEIIKKIAGGQVDNLIENNRKAIFEGMSWQSSANKWKTVFDK